MTDLLPLGPDDLLTTTRAVCKRLDLDRPVPLDVVREALAVALQAPSGGNRQRWHWIILTDPAGLVERRRRPWQLPTQSPIPRDHARCRTRRATTRMITRWLGE